MNIRLYIFNEENSINAGKIISEYKCLMNILIIIIMALVSGGAPLMPPHLVRCRQQVKLTSLADCPQWPSAG